MSFQGDPYRTLGVTPGASLNEIRSAYRRLAKQYHPDAAGERALPRFLAIQAAYERLVDGEGRLRPPGWPGSAAGAGGRGGSRRTGSGGEPWRADPDRAQASRDAWRARRSGGSAGGRGGPAEPPPGTEWARGKRAGGAGRSRGPGGPGENREPGEPGEPGETGTSGEPAGPGARRPGTGRGETGRTDRHGRRTTRKATPGSTTYDEAAETPRDPAWSGGAWYGPSSGTYWTINPREYADPRKHGPEYLARAARALGRRGRDDRPGDPAATADPATDEAGPARPAPGPTAETDGEGDGSRWDWDGGGPTSTAAGDDGWETGGWAYDASSSRPGSGPGDVRPGGDTDGAARAPSVPADAGFPDLETLARRASVTNLLALAGRGDLRSRVVLAILAWPPIGYAVGTLLSTVTGCASFSASCPEPMPLLPVVAQPVVLGLLLTAGAAAAVAAFASLVALAVALPVAAVLSVGTVPESRVGAPVLGVFVAVAYLVALAYGGRAAWRDGSDAPPST
jgi:curved DNA-binding protein CbpA